jgi:hypothetical protein
MGNFEHKKLNSLKMTSGQPLSFSDIQKQAETSKYNLASLKTSGKITSLGVLPLLIKIEQS